MTDDKTPDDATDDEPADQQPDTVETEAVDPSEAPTIPPGGELAALEADTVPPVPGEDELVLDYSAISDVGRVRKDNQDSGYAGPYLLTVCDGVGGAARGDIASSTAVTELRKLDAPQSEASDDLMGRVTTALDQAHVAIGDRVDEDPALNGTSTTSTVALFDGRRIAIAHVGDSRAYLYRAGELSQLTTDHTFVQSLIDEGRITEAEARVHPHRNLILKALDGLHDVEPDVFVLELLAGDRLFLCSDGACGVLDDGRIADILSMGTPDYASVEMVRASLEAGSSDNVTCVVSDVVTAAQAAEIEGYADLEPLLVGAAAELRRRPLRGATGGLFRGHRSGDTGELPAIEEEIPPSVDWAIRKDPIDPEAARYAPRPPGRFTWLRRLMILLLVVGVLWVIAAAAYSWTQKQYYVGEQDGQVVIYRGIDAKIPGISLSSAYQTSDVEIDRLPDLDADRVREGIEVSGLGAAQKAVDKLASLQQASTADSSEDSSGSSDGSTDSTEGSEDSPVNPATPIDPAQPSGAPDSSTAPPSRGIS